MFTSFERRWQLPVYFQLRWKEIVTKLEDTLVIMKLDKPSSKGIGLFVFYSRTATDPRS